ncbi:12066_t:CDS:2 [Entrophospora sp. SA101]|nr:12066_t:CDS:2 [Entrophospora sp. SA101]
MPSGPDRSECANPRQAIISDWSSTTVDNDEEAYFNADDIQICLAEQTTPIPTNKELATT